MQIFAIYLKDTFSVVIADNAMVLRKYLSSIFRKNVKKISFFLSYLNDLKLPNANAHWASKLSQLMRLCISFLWVPLCDDHAKHTV